MIRGSAAALAGVAAFFLAGSHAQASLRLCNQTSYVLYAATAVSQPPNIVTQGWTRIAPGACNQAIAGDLSAPAYYVYARTSQAHSGPSHDWGGADPFCAKDANFTLRQQAGLAACNNDDSFPMPFARIDTHAMRSWTTTFTEGEHVQNMDAARNAGIDRLFGDIGFKIDPHNRADVIKKFRARMKLPANAGDDALIDALETEAMKTATPAGYSICNDSSSAVWAALGLQSGNNRTSRGWWKVMPGTCARAITDPLSAGKIFIHAEGHGDHHLVSGPTNFCVTNITFEVSGAGDCKKRGLTETGFVATDTKGHAGYVVHISQNGLVAARN